MNKNLKLRDDINLFLDISSTDKNKWIVHTHGAGEYAGRHDYLVQEFEDDFNIVRYDVRGHGRSGGIRAWVADFFDFIRDLDELLFYLKQNYQMKNFILMGHSMGSLITCGWIQNFAKNTLYPEKIIITSPPVNIGGPLEKLAIKLPYQLVSPMAEFSLSVPLPGLVDLKCLSHDPQVEIDYRNDVKNCTLLHSKLAFNILKAIKQIYSVPISPKCPAYITVGTRDEVVSYQANIDYFKNIENGFTLKVFDGARHEIHNEIPIYRNSFLEYLHSIIR